MWQLLAFKSLESPILLYVMVDRFPHFLLVLWPIPHTWLDTLALSNCKIFFDFIWFLVLLTDATCNKSNVFNEFTFNRASGWNKIDNIDAHLRLTAMKIYVRSIFHNDIKVPRSDLRCNATKPCFETKQWISWTSPTVWGTRPCAYVMTPLLKLTGPSYEMHFAVLNEGPSVTARCMIPETYWILYIRFERASINEYAENIFQIVSLLQCESQTS